MLRRIHSGEKIQKITLFQAKELVQTYFIVIIFKIMDILLSLENLEVISTIQYITKPNPIISSFINIKITKFS